MKDISEETRKAVDAFLHQYEREEHAELTLPMEDFEGVLLYLARRGISDSWLRRSEAGGYFILEWRRDGWVRRR